jgi:hypothetical protein
MMTDFLDGIGLVVQVFLFAAFLALIVERLVEKFVKPLLPEAYQHWSAYAALALGLIFSWAFGIDLLTPVATAVGLEPFVPWAGYLLTGLIVGGGSNFLHDVWPGGNGPTVHANTWTGSSR